MKVCEECDNPFAKRDNESPRKYNHRRYCGHVCSGKAARRKQLSQPKGHREYIISEVAHLTGTDHPENIARRLGYVSKQGLIQSLTQWNRHDLAERLVAA